MTLAKTSIDWAIDFVATHSDGDLFPKILEVEAIQAERATFISLIEGKDLTQFHPGACRRFIVPKDEFSYRQATQLDLQDSIILSSVVHQFGNGIESRRLPSDRVFSYRFLPTAQDGLYGGSSAWNDFWNTAIQKSIRSQCILYCDIADFYNQVYHHVVENQLIASGFPNQAIKWVISLLESTTAHVSRGVPIGPHAIHLIAEATLIPIDNSLTTSGIEFIRYADDILVFCSSESEAKRLLSQIVSVLDRQQRLMLQRHKTKVYQPDDFRTLCREMIQNRPINAEESGLLVLIKKYSSGNPYKTISYNQFTPSDWSSISESTIRKIIEEYISKDEVDYIRLRWFYRRLSQIGHPGAIQVSLDHLEKLGPCFSNICFYLASIQSIDGAQWKNIGTKLLELLDSEIVKENEYFRLSILSLFTKNSDINHITTLLRMYQSADPFVRREILLAAKIGSAFDWLREHKESYPLMDPWQKMAFIYAISGLPKDDKKFFLNNYAGYRPIEKTLVKWSKNV